jgi:hypothetical protein
MLTLKWLCCATMGFEFGEECGGVGCDREGREAQVVAPGGGFYDNGGGGHYPTVWAVCLGGLAKPVD